MADDQQALGKFCGHSLPSGQLSSRNIMAIQFVTDSEQVYEGFKALYFQGTV